MYRWTLRNKKYDYQLMSSQLKISEEICKILVNRGITTKELITQYLNPTINNLHDPTLMKGLDKAVDIILQGIKENKRFRIIGDYDCDGVMSCYALLSAIKKLNGNVDYAIPHRVYDGYGINNRIVEEAKLEGVDIIITCDNGISAIEAVELARDLGITTIITDHHEIPYKLDEHGQKITILPEADVIVNPKQEDCEYPFKELCGAGVVFKLIQHLYNKAGLKLKDAYHLLQYIAIATVCDIVDLIGENRIIVKNGLKILKSSDNLGLRELIRVNNVDSNNINAYTLGFIIGPCINAAGRLDCADVAMELLLATDEDEAKYLASELYEYNQRRKELTEEGFEKVVNLIEETEIKHEKVKVVYQKGIHESVAGIIAGRVKDKYYRPAIVITDGDGVLKGSARSIEVYDIYEELSNCRDLLVKFGGHSMAAGLSVEEAKVISLRERLNKRFSLSDEELKPKIVLDALLPIHKVDDKLIKELEFLEPFGKGNSKPVFGDKGLGIASARVLGQGEKVLSLKLISSNGKIIDGIYFGDVAEVNEYLENKFGKDSVEKMYLGLNNDIIIDIAYFPEFNTYKGISKKQINILHMR